MRPYDGALIANLTMNLAFAGLSYLLVLSLQNVRGYDAVPAGLLMLPSTLGIFVFIPLGGRLNARIGARAPVLIGLVIMSVGVLVFGFVSNDVSLAVLMVGLVITGLGLGMIGSSAAIQPEARARFIGVEAPLCLIHAPNESVDPSEIANMALTEALFLRNYATARASRV